LVRVLKYQVFYIRFKNLFCVYHVYPKPMENRMKKEKQPEDNVAVWVGVGIAIGAGVGAALDNLAMGIAMGIAIGTAMAYSRKAAQ
jgi:hypothetical protein